MGSITNHACVDHWSMQRINCAHDETLQRHQRLFWLLILRSANCRALKNILTETKKSFYTEMKHEKSINSQKIVTSASMKDNS